MYIVEGGAPISGEIQCMGAKNLASKAIIAALLTDDRVTLHNLPEIQETEIVCNLLESIGVKLTWETKNTLHIDASSCNSTDLHLPLSGVNRIPILMASILLHRHRDVYAPLPGGDKIGKRRVDFHIDAMSKFGAVVVDDDKSYHIHKKDDIERLTASTVELPYSSVGATETCIFLSVLAEGKSVIKNIAMEPEIMSLITMLRAMGAVILFTSYREITVIGVKELHGTQFYIMGDRIEAASWATLACATGGEIIINGIQPETLDNFLVYFAYIGGGWDIIGKDSIRCYREDAKLKPIVIETDVYPGFSTDWQPVFAILLTQADGVSIIHETVYENRLGYLSTLEQFGAIVQVTDHCLGSINCRYKETSYKHSAIITGNTPLVAEHGIRIQIPDIRAGLAYVIAAAVAKGRVELTDIHHIERGYGDLTRKLENTNLDIRKV